MTPQEFLCLGIGFLIGAFFSAAFGQWLEEHKDNKKKPPIYIGGFSNGGY
jgi:hypothetical protein